MKTCIVFGAGGFIGINLSKYLINKGYSVIGVSSKINKYIKLSFSKYIIADLKNIDEVRQCIPENIDEIYQLASTTSSCNNKENNSADLMNDELQINMNILKVVVEKKVHKIFFASSYSVYPANIPINGSWSEIDAYPANPDTEHGWRKILCEKLYSTYKEQYGLNVRIARFHTIYGPYGDYEGVTQKSINALCNKIYNAEEYIDIIGDGTNQRQFLYIDDWINAVMKIMNSEYSQPINISSDKSYTLNEIILKLCIISGKTIKINYIYGNQTAKSKIGNIVFLKNVLHWKQSIDIDEGLMKTYDWIINVKSPS